MVFRLGCSRCYSFSEIHCLFCPPSTPPSFSPSVSGGTRPPNKCPSAASRPGSRWCHDVGQFSGCAGGQGRLVVVSLMLFPSWLWVHRLAFFKYNFICLFLAVLGHHHCVGFSLVVASGGSSRCGARASPGSVCSCCGAWALGCVGFSSCGVWTLERRLNSCGLRA